MATEIRMRLDFKTKANVHKTVEIRTIQKCEIEDFFDIENTNGNAPFIAQNIWGCIAVLTKENPIDHSSVHCKVWDNNQWKDVPQKVLNAEFFTEIN